MAATQAGLGTSAFLCLVRISSTKFEADTKYSQDQCRHGPGASAVPDMDSLDMDGLLGNRYNQLVRQLLAGVG
jgi:hypothetical protein